MLYVIFWFMKCLLLELQWPLNLHCCSMQSCAYSSIALVVLVWGAATTQVRTEAAHPSPPLPILLHFAEVHHHYLCSISIFQHHFYCSSAVFRYHYYCSIIVFQNHFYCSISEFKYHYYCSITVFQNHFYGSISIFQCHYYCNMRKCTTTSLAVFWSNLHSSTTHLTQHHRVLQLKPPSTFMQLTHHHFKHCKYMAGICSEFSINH